MNYFKDLRKGKVDPSVEKEVSEKLYAAEKNVAIMRILVVAFNVFVYIFFLDKTHTVEWLSWLIIVLSAIYSLFVLRYQPYKKYSLMLSSIFTSGSDGLFIALWIYSTGGVYSPYSPLWYVSIIAIALRYSMKVTVRTAIIYAVINAVIIIGGADYKGYETDIVVRTGYLFLVGGAAALMSKEIMAQIEAKILIRKSQRQLRLREQELQEARNLLEERVNIRTKELYEKNRELKIINEDLDSFVYSASHDLKTPLSNMEALLSIMEEEQEHNQEKTIVKEKLILSLHRMKATINKLAEVARAQKEIYDDIEQINFDGIFKEIVMENEEIIKESKADISTDFAAFPSISFSRLCIKSIMYNLVSNAIKYRAQNRDLKINLFTRSHDGSHYLYVKDNGMGIDLIRNKKKMFTIFKRFHDHVEGAGIGLHMVKRMVEKFGGSIDVESEPDKGATFIIQFRT